MADTLAAAGSHAEAGAVIRELLQQQQQQQQRPQDARLIDNLARVQLQQRGSAPLQLTPGPVGHPE